MASNRGWRIREWWVTLVECRPPFILPEDVFHKLCVSAGGGLDKRRTCGLATVEKEVDQTLSHYTPERGKSALSATVVTSVVL